MGAADGKANGEVEVTVLRPPNAEMLLPPKTGAATLTLPNGDIAVLLSIGTAEPLLTFEKRVAPPPKVWEKLPPRNAGAAVLMLLDTGGVVLVGDAARSS